MDSEERRKYSRARTLKTARIIFNLRRSVIDCTVRNMSSRGACVDVVGAVRIPERFDLEVDHASHPCRVIWRKEDRLGVSFG